MLNLDEKLSKQYAEKIEKVLDTIRPYMETDGGNVKYLGITSDYILKLELLGNCSSCKMSTMTLKAGVEESIRKEFPEIKTVEAINATLAF
jgi:Fe-S cluster biogenesis protein NfuA